MLVGRTYLIRFNIRKHLNSQFWALWRFLLGLLNAKSEVPPRSRAQVLAGLAYRQRDALQAHQAFTQAALEHLAHKAQEDEVIYRPVATALSPACVGPS